MTREIKFRTWYDNKIVKGMNYTPTFIAVASVEVLNMPTKVNAVETTRTTLDVNDMIEKMNSEDSILMQYTGLKDKNGTSIFESDYIMWRCKGSIVEGEVYWSCDGWKVKDLNGGNVTRLGKASTISIIGNKWEEKKENETKLIKE